MLTQIIILLAAVCFKVTCGIKGINLCTMLPPSAEHYIIEEMFYFSSPYQLEQMKSFL